MPLVNFQGIGESLGLNVHGLQESDDQDMNFDFIIVNLLFVQGKMNVNCSRNNNVCRTKFQWLRGQGRNTS